MLVRQYFWPGLNRDIDNITNCCEQCLRYHNKQKSGRAIPHEIPLVPWTKMGTDLFCLKSKSHLIVVDYTSNFFDISQLPDKLSSTVVTHTKRIFSKFATLFFNRPIRSTLPSSNRE